MKSKQFKIWARVLWHHTLNLFLTLFIVASVIGGLIGIASLLVKLARFIHDYFCLSWNDTIAGIVTGIFFVCFLSLIAWTAGGSDALSAYFDSIWRRAEKEVEYEEASGNDKETLLRGSGK